MSGMAWTPQLGTTITTSLYSVFDGPKTYKWTTFQQVEVENGAEAFIHMLNKEFEAGNKCCHFFPVFFYHIVFLCIF